MMKNNATEHPRRWRRRAIGALGALVITGSALALTAAVAAAADPHCNYPHGSNTCLTLESREAFYKDALVGFEVQMSEERAQFIIDWHRRMGSLPVGVEIIAHDHDDPADDTSGLEEIGDDPDDLYEVWAGPNGLNGSFAEKVPCRILNEDRGDDERDEVVARVTLYAPDYPKPVPLNL
jgi:hypothetical protein